MILLSNKKSTTRMWIAAAPAAGAALLLVFFLTPYTFSLTPSVAHAAARLQMPPNYLTLNSGLVGYWTFDGATTTWSSATAGITGDLSGNFNTGTLTNMNRATAPAIGKIGQALRFTDGTDYVDINTPGIQAVNYPLTVVFWAKPNNLAFQGMVIGLIPGGNYHGWGLWDDQIFVGAEGTVKYAVASTNGIAANKWSHWAVTNTLGAQTLYINGVNIPLLTGSLEFGNATYQIGGRANGTERQWQGDIDDVRIYNRVLSAAEVLNLYNSGQAKMRAAVAQKKIFITSGTTFTAPSDWPGIADKIECIGGGGGGSGGNSSAQQAGGGGAYSKALNVGVSNGATLQVGAGGAGGASGAGANAGSNGTDTWFNGASLAASSCGAKAGSGGIAGTGGPGGVGTSGVGSTRNSGGDGASGSSISAGSGAGGAAGPNGVGKAGGQGNSGQGGGGGGGGGNGGGSVGNNNVATGNGGNGGDNSSSSGHGVGATTSGAAGTAGTVGGGGGGGAGFGLGATSGNGGAGGPGTEWDSSHGSGGGGGGGGAGNASNIYANGGNGGLYGGGGGSASNDGQGVAGGTGGSGANGIIVITYTSKTTINKSNAIISSGLVGYWTFDGATTTWSSATAGITGDSSGNFNTGTLTNMSRATSPAIGKIGQALKFDGVDDLVDVATALDNINPNEGSVSVWVYRTFENDEATRRKVFGFTSGNTAFVVFGFEPAGDLWQQFKRVPGADSTFTFSANTIPKNTWVHVVVNWSVSGNRLETFVNGVSVGNSNNILSQAGAYSETGQIGLAKDAGEYWPGKIDDVRIYNRALSAAEVLQLYNAGK